MDAAGLYRLIEDPSRLGSDTLAELRTIVRDYPYFQVARLLYLKNLALLSDNSFDSELRKMSIFMSDRKRLFKLIEGDKYAIDPMALSKHGDSGDSFSLIDAFLSSHEDSKPEGVVEKPLMFQPSVSSDYIFWSLSSEGEKHDEIGEDKRLQHHDLIDSFIENEQQRSPGSGLPFRDKSAVADMPESVRELDDDSTHKSLEDSCLTETLARIYIKQRRYEKALQIIKNLSLKYPEKNVYFADQIRFLEKLIINTKK